MFHLYISWHCFYNLSNYNSSITLVNFNNFLPSLLHLLLFFNVNHLFSLKHFSFTPRTFTFSNLFSLHYDKIQLKRPIMTIVLQYIFVKIGIDNQLFTVSKYVALFSHVKPSFITMANCCTLLIFFPTSVSDCSSLRRLSTAG